MPIRIDARELHDLLATTPSEQNIMLMGKHGIGKSQIITRFYEQRGMPVHAFFLGQMSDPGDLLGLPHKDEATGRTVFLPPFWWPVDGRPIVLFLDELNRARPEILQAIFDLALNRKLAGRALPAGSIVIAAVNAGDEDQLTELDPALVSRFNLYEFAPTHDDWLVWASAAQVDERVIAFIQKNPHFLDGETASAEDALAFTGLVKSPDRRAWARVSDFIKPLDQLEDIHVKGVAGIVGTQAAIAFRESLGERLRVSAEELLLHYDKHGDKVEQLAPEETILLNEQVMLWLNGERVTANNSATIQANLLRYLKTLQRKQYNESVAHFAALFENPRYETAMGVIAESLDLVELLMSYIEGIKV